jgi:hypothetical protein
MWGSTLVYLGISLAFAGCGLLAKPIRRLGVPTRRRALALVGSGVALSVVGLFLPVSDSRAARAQTRQDEFMPVWQFAEYHSLRIAAPPSRVFAAMKAVRADEIFLFHTLTWIRRGGRGAPVSLLNASSTEPLIDIATRGGFVRLAEDVPREFVLGAVVLAPPGTRGTLTPEIFQEPFPPGFGLATMNFLVTPDGPHGSVISTETRVYANSASARRRFAAYWRVIYPGSALIRRMWLRAIERRSQS